MNNVQKELDNATWIGDEVEETERAFGLALITAYWKARSLAAIERAKELVREEMRNAEGRGL